MLVILSGVSGAGKDTIKKELIKRMPNIVTLPSFTSRDMRLGEVEGDHYHFISKEEFESKRTEILQSYETERNKSCERGTKIHAQFENMYYQSEEQDLKKFGLGGKFTCKKGYYQLDLEKGVYPEFMISYKSDDGILRIAGQLDLLIKDGNDIYIYDYKART